jgi:hypothetical protein
MEKHEFELEIRKNGEVKVHIKGVKGKRCIDYVKFLQEVVGPVKEQNLTHEYYEPDSRAHVEGEEKQRVREMEE